MTSPEHSISPRGVPPIRPDWLVDVAWRLADLGLGAMRGLGEDARFVLTDVVDGAPWRFESRQLSEPWATSVEHDADLFIPSDGDAATLRAGFQFTPWWDGERGACIQARVEIGPRGPVTFDPENWFVLLPLPGAARPAVEGVEPGTWVVDGEAASTTPAKPTDLTGLSLSLADVGRVVVPEAAVRELSLVAAPLVRRRGLLGRGKLVPAEAPTRILRIWADGPIDASWTGHEPLDAAIDEPGLVVGSVEPGDGQVTVRGKTGVLTLTGPQLQVTVAAPPSGG